jgi:RND family efflux transporter MFP subunit
LNTSEYVPQTIYTAKLVATGRNGWEYQYDTHNFKGPAPKDWIVEAQNDLALKKGKLDDAQQTYDSLLAGEDSTDVIAARASVDAAQATVNMLSIIAPFDGKVLSVEQRAGEVVNTGDLSVNLADMDHLYVDTQVDESDIANVKLGNQAEVTLDAVPDVVLSGKVTAINPVGENISGLVKYTVRVDLDKVSANTFLPLGTTSNVVITVKDATVNLAVPITAIQNDANGEYVWVIQSDGSTKRIDIVSGAIVGDEVVVTGDLKEGDRIQMVSQSSFQAPGFGGGN